MGFLTKADILGVKDSRTAEIDLTDLWGGSVIVRTLTAAEKGRFEQKMMGKNVDYSSVLAEYCSMIMVDESGDNLFTAQDVKALAGKSAKALQRVFDKGQELNSFTTEDVEALAKNS